MMFSIARSPLVLAVATSFGVLSLSACGVSDPGAPKQVEQISADSVARFPGEEGWTPQQRLQTVLSHEGQYGAVRGEILTEGESQLADPDDPRSIVTSYTFRILATHGARARLFSKDEIQIVAPGGRFGDVLVQDDDAPTFEQGEEVVVFAQFENQRPTAAGRNTPQRLVVESDANVARVLANRDVTWQGWTTTLDNFTQTLDRNPSRRHPDESSRGR